MQQSHLPSEQPQENKKYDQLQSTFVRSVEHQLRTPLTVIQGYAELLFQGALGALDPDQEKAVFAITNRARELWSLVEQVNTFLAFKAEVIPTELLDLNDLVTEVVETYSSKAEQGRITLTVQLSSDLPLVTGQSCYLRQVIECLVDNALKFTAVSGRVEVQVDTESGWVYLTVADNGVGIVPEELDQIFTPFYQVDHSNTDQCKGLGLGLTIVKAVIEAFGGQVAVESQPGQGSRFTIKLPARPTTAKVHNSKTVDQTSSNTTKPQRILIVDDEESLAITLQAGLEKLPNCEIVYATSGQQALQYFDREPFDLLITDYKMPDMDGLTLAARINEGYPQTIIIMITAYGSMGLHEQAADICIQDILNKPVEINWIRQIVSKALGGPESRNTAEPEC